MDFLRRFARRGGRDVATQEHSNYTNYLSVTNNMDCEQLRQFIISFFSSFPKEQSIIEKEFDPKQHNNALNMAFDLFIHSTSYEARVQCAHLISMLIVREDLYDSDFLSNLIRLTHQQTINDIAFHGIFSLTMILLCSMPGASGLNNFYAAKEFIKFGLHHEDYKVNNAAVAIVIVFLKWNWSKDKLLEYILKKEGQEHGDIHSIKKMGERVMKDVMNDIVQCAVRPTVEDSKPLQHMLEALGQDTFCYEVDTLLKSMLEAIEEDNVATVIRMIFARVCEVFEENVSHCHMCHYEKTAYILYINAGLLILRIEIRTKPRVGEVYSLYYSRLIRSFKKMLPVCLANGDLDFANRIFYCFALLREQVEADVFRGDAVEVMNFFLEADPGLAIDSAILFEWSDILDDIGKDFAPFAAMLMDHYVHLLTKHNVDKLFEGLYNLLMAIEDQGPSAVNSMWRRIFYPLLQAVTFIHDGESKEDLCVTLEAIRHCLFIPAVSADLGNTDFPKLAELLLHLLRRYHRVREVDVGDDDEWDKRILQSLDFLIYICVENQEDMFSPLLEPVLPQILRLLRADNKCYEKISGLSMLGVIAVYAPSTAVAHQVVLFPATVPYLNSDYSDVRTEAAETFQVLVKADTMDSVLNFLDDFNQYATRPERTEKEIEICECISRKIANLRAQD